MNFLSVNTTLFTFLGYQMSYLEFAGTLFNLASVITAVRNNYITWPMGVVGGFLFAALFYQIQLYSDLVEQIFYIATGFWGWWVWLNPKTKKEADKDKRLKISNNSRSANIAWIASIIAISIVSGFFMSRIHFILPKLFPIPASFAYLDALTTVMSFAATILMAKKRIECWYLWISVDVIGIGLYFARGTIFLSLLYLIFLVLASKGYFNWKKIRLAYTN